jgi:hypothetical protein
MAKPKPPTVHPVDDFSIDGKRIRRSVNARLMAGGWKWCSAHNGGAGAVVALDRFADHAKLSHHHSGYCAACHSAQSLASARKQTQGSKK